MTRIAEDFAAIRARLGELGAERRPDPVVDDMSLCFAIVIGRPDNATRRCPQPLLAWSRGLLPWRVIEWQRRREIALAISLGLQPPPTPDIAIEAGGIEVIPDPVLPRRSGPA